MVKSNEDNQDKLDGIMDKYYSYIGQNHIQNILDVLSSKEQEITSTKVPDSLDTWFNEYIKETKKKDKDIQRKIQFEQRMSKTAIILLIISISLITLTFNVEAIRVKVLNWFIEMNDEYTEICIDENSQSENTVKVKSNFYEPSFIPEDYVMENIENTGDAVIIEYNSMDGGYMVFTQSPNGTDFQLDTEDAIICDVMVNENKGMMIEKEGRNIIFWNNDQYSFFILSDMCLELCWI